MPSITKFFLKNSRPHWMRNVTFLLNERHADSPLPLLGFVCLFYVIISLDVNLHEGRGELTASCHHRHASWACCMALPSDRNCHANTCGRLRFALNDFEFIGITCLKWHGQNPFRNLLKCNFSALFWPAIQQSQLLAFVASRNARAHNLRVMLSVKWFKSTVVFFSCVCVVRAILDVK